MNYRMYIKDESQCCFCRVIPAVLPRFVFVHIHKFTVLTRTTLFAQIFIFSSAVWFFPVITSAIGSNKQKLPSWKLWKCFSDPRYRVSAWLRPIFPPTFISSGKLLLLSHTWKTKWKNLRDTCQLTNNWVRILLGHTLLSRWNHILLF